MKQHVKNKNYHTYMNNVVEYVMSYTSMLTKEETRTRAILCCIIFAVLIFIIKRYDNYYM